MAAGLAWRIKFKKGRRRRRRDLGSDDFKERERSESRNLRIWASGAARVMLQELVKSKDAEVKSRAEDVVEEAGAGGGCAGA